MMSVRFYALNFLCVIILQEQIVNSFYLKKKKLKTINFFYIHHRILKIITLLKDKKYIYIKYSLNPNI